MIDALIKKKNKTAVLLINTVESPNSHNPNSHLYGISDYLGCDYKLYPYIHTPNSHTYPNSHILFSLTKIWLFGYGKDFEENLAWILSLVDQSFWEIV